MVYSHTGRSIPQRIVGLVAETVSLAVAFWLLLGDGLATINRWFGWGLAEPALARRYILLACLCIVYVRIFFTGFYLLKRAMGWEEALSVMLGFMIYYVGFPLLATGRLATNPPFPIGWGDILAVIVFLLGSFINTYGEILRDIWRKKPENQGKLYTGGFFRYARHINYFGDILWVSALAWLTRNPWAGIIPFVLLLFFALFNAPELDRHLQAKYPAAFAEYKKRTKMLIPFIL